MVVLDDFKNLGKSSTRGSEMVEAQFGHALSCQKIVSEDLVRTCIIVSEDLVKASLPILRSIWFS